MINFRAKTKPGEKSKKAAKSPARASKKAISRALTAADIAEINLFDRVIAKMNLRADERRRAAKAKA